MSNTTLRQAFGDIADAIRAKGVTGTMTPLEMPSKIENLPEHDPRYEVNQQGGLVKKSFVVDQFDDLTSISDNGLQYAYYQSGVTSASFPNVTSIGTGGLNNAFRDCTSLTSIDLSNVTSIGTSGLNSAFRNCTSLSSVDLSSLTSALVNSGLANAFQGCTSLISVDISRLTSIGNSGLYSTFYGCTSLKSVYLSSLSSTTGTSDINFTFRDCASLELVDFSEATAVPTIATNVFYNTNNTFKIVVPDALYESWKTASNWSVRASQIVKASEYTPAT